MEGLLIYPYPHSEQEVSHQYIFDAYVCMFALYRAPAASSETRIFYIYPSLYVLRYVYVLSWFLVGRSDVRLRARADMKRTTPQCVSMCL